VSSRRSRGKKLAMPESADNRFAREFMEIARRVAATAGGPGGVGEAWEVLCDMVTDYREGKKVSGIAER